MKDINYLYLILTKALKGDSNNPNSQYFYHKEADIIVIVEYVDGLCKQIHRGKKSLKESTIKDFLIFKEGELISKDTDLIEPPKLTLKEMRSFLEMMHSEFQSEFELLKIDFNYKIDEGDSFELKLNLRDIDKKLHYQISLLKEKFIGEKIREYYWPLGVSENTLII